MSEIILGLFVTFGSGVIGYLLKEINTLKMQNQKLENIIIGFAFDLQENKKSNQEMAKDILNHLAALNGRLIRDDYSSALE